MPLSPALAVNLLGLNLLDNDDEGRDVVVMANGNGCNDHRNHTNNCAGDGRSVFFLVLIIFPLMNL